VGLAGPLVVWPSCFCLPVRARSRGDSVISGAEQIAQSAALAAWGGAIASTFAAVVALGVAVWGARREESHRKRFLGDQQAAFAFGMIGALERIKPIIVEAQSDPSGQIARRNYGDMVDHAHMIADAALAIPMFDMQMLRDAYLLRGVLNALRSLLEERPGDDVKCSAVLQVIEPTMDAVLDADGRFARRIPSMASIEGAQHRIPIDRAAAMRTADSNA